MTTYRKKLLLVSSLIAVAVIGIAFQQQHETHVDKAPAAVTELASRSTELGTALVKPLKSDSEMDIKLTDPAMTKKWGLELTDSYKAWSGDVKATGSRDIVVAVIDTGIDIHHVDLQKNLWVNKGEVGMDAEGRDKATNGVDDDNNGFIDDVHGVNFVGQTTDLSDNHGHGTHIAGIIGAEGGNGVGISGVAPRVSLMILKYYDPHAYGGNNLNNTVRAIDYATRMGAHIINYSGGGLQPSESEKQAIARAQKKGVLFVAAAGNEKSNSDVNGYYPADYELDNIISVTAIDRGKNVLPSSNYGEQTVDIAAPGNDIFSTLPSGQYGQMTGTSQATAFVSGVAALIKAKYPDFEAKKVIRHILENGTEDEKLVGKTRYRKRLNTYRALANLDQDVTVNGTVAKNTQNLSPTAFAATADPVLEPNEDLTGSGLLAITTGREINAFLRATQKVIVAEEANKRAQKTRELQSESEAPPQE
ncbi:MAG: S8 family serine peptidase [Pseudobdellovibrionaceae bacterium]|nr:S8 family serine peptidase [Bdellovibrionales bacterium]USN47611.1 MAG: S8 family serine peptidase [Pseudobdellovibrionaceae bacterium]